MKKYLAIDHGLSRIGLALGDSENKIATPFRVVVSLDEIKTAIVEEEIDELVVGVPTALSTTEDDQEKIVREFIAELKTETELPIHEVDERFTSRMAEGAALSRQDKKMSDAVAAMYILQSHFDAM